MRLIRLSFLLASVFLQMMVLGQRNISVSLLPVDCIDPSGFKDFFESVRIFDRVPLINSKHLVVLQYHNVKPFPDEVFLLTKNESRPIQPSKKAGKAYFEMILVKEKRSSKMMVIPDLNFNGNFADDSVRHLDPVTGTTRMFDLPVERIDRKGIIHQEIRHVQVSVNFVFTEDGKSHPSVLASALSKSWRGVIDFDGETYEVAASGVKKGFGDRITFAFEEKGRAFSNADYLYSAGDTVFTKKHVFLINDLDTATQQVSLSFLGENTDRTGIVPGFFIKNTKFIDVRTSGEVLLFSGNKSFTLLDCWGTWCGPCKALTPDLKKMAKKFSDRLEIVGLALDDSIQPVRKYLKKNSIRWNNLFIPVKKSGGPRIVNQLKIIAYPTFILTNKDGLILIRTNSAGGLKEIASFLEKNPG